RSDCALMVGAADGGGAPASIGLRNILADGGVGGARAAKWRPLAFRLRPGGRGAGGSGVRGGAARSLPGDGEGGAGGWLPGLRRPPVSSLRSRGGRSVLARAAHAHAAPAGESSVEEVVRLPASPLGGCLVCSGVASRVRVWVLLLRGRLRRREDISLGVPS